jgi:ankyrin repeat protein
MSIFNDLTPVNMRTLETNYKLFYSITDISQSTSRNIKKYKSTKSQVQQKSENICTVDAISKDWCIRRGAITHPCNAISSNINNNSKNNFNLNYSYDQISSSGYSNDRNTCKHCNNDKTINTKTLHLTATCYTKFATESTVGKLINQCLCIDPIRHILNEFIIGLNYVTLIAEEMPQWNDQMKNFCNFGQKTLLRNGTNMLKDTDIDTLTIGFLNFIANIRLRGCFYELKSYGMVWHGGIQHEYLKWVEDKAFTNYLRIYHTAARVGMYETVVNLIDDVTINSRDLSDRTAIMNAARNRHPNVMKYILSKAPNYQRLATDVDSNGLTILMHAAHGGDTDCLKYALKLPGVDVNQKTSHAIDYNYHFYAKGLSALTIASYWGHIECVKLLFQVEGIDVNCQNDEGFTPLLCGIQHPEIMKVFFENPDVDVNILTTKLLTPIMGVAYMRYEQSVDVFVQNPKVLINYSKHDGMTVLSVAAKRGMTQMVRALLTRSDLDCTKTSLVGFNALHEAAFEGHSECVALLMNAPGIKVNARSEDHMTAFMMAAQCGSVASILCLIEHPEIDIHLTCRTSDGTLSNALTFAKNNNHMDIVNILLKKGCGDPGK